MKKDKFDITGMTCSACSTRVEQCIRKLPGVQNVSVNLLKNSMVVSCDEQALDTAGIIEAVEQAGYGAIVRTNASPRSNAARQPETAAANTAQAEYQAMKQRLFLSALFTIPLFYISMGHMMNWPLPGWLLGMENAMTFAFTQFLLLPVLLVNSK